MPKNCQKKAFAFLVAILVLLCQMISFASSSVTIKGTTVNVRSGPGTSYKILGTVNLGNKLVPLGIENDKSGNGKKWYKFVYQDGKTGYVRTDFCKEMATYVYDAQFETDLDRKGFPESYKEGLRDLHANYPNWTFTLFNTGIDFNYAVEQESIGAKTLVNATAISSYKSTDAGKYDINTSTWTTYDGSAWVAASKEAIACYMDPRNFLYDPYIFQFESQKFNVNIQTLDAVKEMVKGTFLEGTVTTSGLSGNTMQQIIPIVGFTGTDIESLGPAAYLAPGVSSNTSNIIGPGSGNSIPTETSFPFTYLPMGTYTYAELIFDACRQVNANPYVIVSMILQEQGKNGTDSISGKNKKFPNAYNFGNVNAFAGGGLSSIENGLKYASEVGSYNRPWNTVEKGIYGLCDFYANSYVSVGQDTFYLKKWNVQGQNMFKHQYMTNVSGAATEGQLLGNIYDQILLSLPHEFKIPYFNNMPSVAAPVPTKDGSPNNYLKLLSVDNQIMTPQFSFNTYDYAIAVDSSISSVKINAEAFDGRAKVSGKGTVSLNNETTVVNVDVVAENGDIKTYRINIYRPMVANITVPESNVYSPIENQAFDFSALPIIIPAGQAIKYTQNSNIIIPGASAQVGVGPGQ